MVECLAALRAVLMAALWADKTVDRTAVYWVAY